MSLVLHIGTALAISLTGHALPTGAAAWLPQGNVATGAAMKMLGVPYSWGGGGPRGPTYGVGRGAKTRGFDCAGLTEYAWAQAGVRIGASSYEQWRAGQKVIRTRVRAGDLVFFDTKPKQPGPDHVGLAVSNTQMVVAPYTGAVVRLELIDRLSYLGAIRPSPQGARL
ncbi:NlpC/P60 family protein [Nonomuraea sp. NBC_01738]|uniref:C40 family peptidase n=1 Tax=Nonomuraea sp. NBC_01738 TaxID=2976003 RepID=UPI002E123C3F|nr:NlpC/P60 family protein [Nonomuraea sp. NBC_01738]